MFPLIFWSIRTASAHPPACRPAAPPMAPTRVTGYDLPKPSPWGCHPTQARWSRSRKSADHIITTSGWLHGLRGWDASQDRRVCICGMDRFRREPGSEADRLAPSLFEWAPPSGVGAAERTRGAGGPIMSTGFFRTVSRAADGLTVLADDVPVGILQLAEDAGGQDGQAGLTPAVRARAQRCRVARSAAVRTLGRATWTGWVAIGREPTPLREGCHHISDTVIHCPSPCARGCTGGCTPRAVRVCVVAGSLARAAQCGCHGSGYCANSLDSLTARPACLPEARAVAPRSRRCRGRDCGAARAPGAITEPPMHDLTGKSPAKMVGWGAMWGAWAPVPTSRQTDRGEVSRLISFRPSPPLSRSRGEAPSSPLVNGCANRNPCSGNA